MNMCVYIYYVGNEIFQRQILYKVEIIYEIDNLFFSNRHV